MLEPSGAEVGAEWVQVGHIWGNFWPKVTPNGADDVAAMSDRQDAFGLLRRYAKCANYHSRETTFGALSRANMPPHPHLKLYQSDRSVRITRCETTTPRHLRRGRILFQSGYMPQCSSMFDTSIMNCPWLVCLYSRYSIPIKFSDFDRRKWWKTPRYLGVSGFLNCQTKPHGYTKNIAWFYNVSQGMWWSTIEDKHEMLG